MTGSTQTDLALIGIDLAKQIFHLHGATDNGTVLFRKKIRRSQLLGFVCDQPRCIIAMEACASSHYWAREFERMGHTVKMIPPVYVKPFVKRQKNDANDAEAIVEAALRPNMTLVAPKSEEQQGRAMIFRAREILVTQRTQLINSLRGLLAEFGIVAPQGRANVAMLSDELHSPCSTLPDDVIEVGQLMLDQIDRCQDKIDALMQKARIAARQDEEAQRVMTIPGIGPITALALQAFAPDLRSFENGRHFAAWLGLVPRQTSTGGKQRLGRTSKMGQRDIRRLLISGAMAVVRVQAQRGASPGSWMARMLDTKPKKLVAVALANKMARMVWAISTKGTYYTPSVSEVANVGA